MVDKNDNKQQTFTREEVEAMIEAKANQLKNDMEEAIRKQKTNSYVSNESVPLKLNKHLFISKEVHSQRFVVQLFNDKGERELIENDESNPITDVALEKTYMNKVKIKNSETGKVEEILEPHTDKFIEKRQVAQKHESIEGCLTYSKNIMYDNKVYELFIDLTSADYFIDRKSSDDSMQEKLRNDSFDLLGQGQKIYPEFTVSNRNNKIEPEKVELPRLYTFDKDFKITNLRNDNSKIEKLLKSIFK